MVIDIFDHRHGVLHGQKQMKNHILEEGYRYGQNRIFSVHGGFGISSSLLLSLS